jgi:hypothetical protein
MFPPSGGNQVLKCFRLAGERDKINIKELKRREK